MSGIVSRAARGQQGPSVPAQPAYLSQADGTSSSGRGALSAAQIVQHVQVLLPCRRTNSGGRGGFSASDDVVVPMDAIGDAYVRLANDNRVGGYIKAAAR